MDVLHRALAPLTLLLAVTACAAPQVVAREGGQLLVPQALTPPATWSQDTQHTDVTVRRLSDSDGRSVRLARVSGALKPHVYDDVDAVLVLMEGQAKVTVAGQSFVIKQGAVVELPRGTEFAAENQAQGGCLFYVVTTPGIKSGTARLVDGATHASAGQGRGAWKYQVFPD